MISLSAVTLRNCLWTLRMLEVKKKVCLEFELSLNKLCLVSRAHPYPPSPRFNTEIICAYFQTLTLSISLPLLAADTLTPSSAFHSRSRQVLSTSDYFSASCQVTKILNHNIPSSVQSASLYLQHTPFNKIDSNHPISYPIVYSTGIFLVNLCHQLLIYCG